MDLSYSDSLRELPDLSTATNLCKLVLKSCTGLVELPCSIGNATNLRILSLDDCSNLRELPSSISNATNLEDLRINGCSNLVKLPFSIENAINLKLLRLDFLSGEVSLEGCSSLVDLPSYIWNASLTVLELNGCSSLVEISSSIGNAINLQKLDLGGCTNLVKLPSSIGNAINLKKLDLSGCTNLVELPSSIGNVFNLMEWNLSGCSSLVELPSSIGYLHNLLKLGLKGCSKLVVIPTNINMVNLHELDLTNCSLLKTFPEISTNTRVLNLSGTAIEEVPSSLRSLSCLEELHLSDTRIQEIAPWVKELPCLDRLVIKGCTNLVSLPQLPDSLRFLDADNCESLEGLHSSFHNAKIVDLNFANCFKLNQETKFLILKPSTCSFALFPGETVPTHFTYRANGSSLSMKPNGIGMRTTRYVRFKACVLLVYKGDVKDSDRNMFDVYISHCIKEKQNGVDGFLLSKYVSLQSPLLKKHLFIFDFDEAVSSSELVFEVRVNDNKWEIEECGICTPTD